MKKKYMVLWVLFFLPFASLFADVKVGLSLGLDRNSVERTDGYSYIMDTNAAMGFSLSLPIEVGINSWLSLRLEPTYIQKNYATETNDSISSWYATSLDYTNSYISLPLLFKFSHSFAKENPLSLYVDVGGFYEYWISQEASGTELSLLNTTNTSSSNYLVEQEGSIDFDEDIDNRFYYGWLIGTGLDITLSKHFEGYFEVRYIYSISGRYQDYQSDMYNQYNRTFLAITGLMYRF